MTIFLSWGTPENRIHLNIVQFAVLTFHAWDILGIIVFFSISSAEKITSKSILSLLLKLSVVINGMRVCPSVGHSVSRLVVLSLSEKNIFIC